MSLPPIQIVSHPRSKRLKLSVSPRGIRLTLPPQSHMDQARAFLSQHQHWLTEQWQHSQPQGVLPHTLQVSYYATPLPINYHDQHETIVHKDLEALTVPTQNAAYHLTQAIIQLACDRLPTVTQQYASQLGLEVSAIKIGTPRTRWGSCNHRKIIRLHAGLLLMPQSWADYVIFHELAHLCHLHHQAEFWQLLEHWYPQAKAVQHNVKRFRLPPWWQPDI